jgi:allantoinase
VARRRKAGRHLQQQIEYFAFGAGLGTDSTGAAAAQSQRNYAWRDYGNRVGLWYYFNLLDEFALPGAHNVNSAVLEYCPDIVGAPQRARR